MILILNSFSSNLGYRIIESIDDISTLDSSLQNYYSYGKTTGRSIRDLGLTVIPDQVVAENQELKKFSSSTRGEYENGRGKILIMTDRHNGVIAKKVKNLQKYRDLEKK